MKRYLFECEFLSDVMISAHTATEGQAKTLDFVPGANFLGVLAKNYDNYSPELAYDLFHSGKVRFSDAHPVYDNQRCFRAPLDWFTKKSDSKSENKTTVYLNHILKQDTRDEFRKKGEQLKQVRDGFYAVADGDYLKLKSDTCIAVKSAQDRETRRSKDAQMFVYESLQAGSKWQFYVESDIEIETQLHELTGAQRLGKSRSAQYGEVRIKQLSSCDIAPEQIEPGTVLLYADSNLMFFDESGAATFKPTATQLGLPADSEICWEKCQLRTSVYAPWNYKRYTREADRNCINKGSIFVIEVKQSFDTSIINQGVGAYTNEGFGQLLINPEFLKSENSICIIEKKDDMNEEKEQDFKITVTEKDDLAVMQMIDAEQKRNNLEANIIAKVNEFERNYSGIYRSIKPSQWGQIRSIASQCSSNKDLEEKLWNTKESYLKHGVAKDDWNQRGRINKLQEVINGMETEAPEFMVLLAATMAKNNKKTHL